ncbi:MAG: class I SAM-dependent RNA methyltransferase [Clostridiales Family XIII bacterium]|jgi:23S rRNA (uracil1939-C5)-methyltransferase|nr:class I SAM-dependent RNA methyltransferase [Clostridiales Family XIII bacterium]
MNAEIGMAFIVEVSDIGRDGHGIGKADGLTVFVEGLIPGDKARVTVTNMKKNLAFAATDKIIEPSPFRIAPKCHYADACGGCALMSMEYSAQTRMKELHVREALSRIGGIQNPNVRPIISMNDPWGYRNKAVYAVRGGKVGFYDHGSHNITDIPYCLIQTPAANAVAAALRSFLAVNSSQLKLGSSRARPSADQRTVGDRAAATDGNDIRSLTVKTAEGSGEVMVVLGFERKLHYGLDELILMMDEAVNELSDTAAGGAHSYSLESAAITFEVKQRGAKAAERCEIIAGKRTITESTAQARFEISPQSFFQVNPAGARALESIILEYAKLSGSETVLDLYCGVGVLGLICAPYAGSVVGIEVVKQAVIDANRNAVINGIVNASFICGKAEEELQKLYGGNAEEHRPSCGAEVETESQILCGAKADVIIIDPPRAGCDVQLLKAMAELKPKKIIYVSCDPATLARDVKILTRLGYEFIEATPVDMFPHTVHVECVVMMTNSLGRHWNPFP